MDAKMQAWRKRMPSKRQLTSTLGTLVQQKSVAVLYTPTEQERINQMTDMITQATSDYEADEDWGRILRVVDALSSVSNRAVLKESVHYLRLRLGDPSARVVILALTLTESLVKNCGDLVHQEIATEAFMNEMEAVYKTHAKKRGRDSMEIASRVLDMVQAWGEAFLPYRHEFPLFVDTYHNMRKKGVKFPEQYDESKVPVLTSPPAAACHNRAAASFSQPSTAANAGAIDTSSFSNSGSGLGGLSTPELYRVAQNVSEMFGDMLFEAHKDSASIGTHGVIEEMAVQAREIVHRMEGAIQVAVNDDNENVERYLTVNDDLHSALAKYDTLLQSNQEAGNSSTKPDSAGVTGEDIDLIDPFGLEKEITPPSNQEPNDDDDPFADFVRARAGSHSKSSERGSLASEAAIPAHVEEKAKAPPKPAVPQKNDDDDDDPFASFVQQRATKLSSSSNSYKAEVQSKPAALAPAKDLIDLWDESTPTPAPTAAQPTTKQDLWLGDDFLSSSNQLSGSVPSASSKPLMADLWAGANMSKSSASASSFPAPLSTTSSITSTNNNDPFDLLDFSKKPTISSPANPFDAIPTTAPMPTPPQPQQQPSNQSFNPFDF